MPRPSHSSSFHQLNNICSVSRFLSHRLLVKITELWAALFRLSTILVPFEVRPSFQKRLSADELLKSCTSSSFKGKRFRFFFHSMFRPSRSFTWCKIAVSGQKIQFWHQYDIGNSSVCRTRAHTHIFTHSLHWQSKFMDEGKRKNYVLRSLFLATRPVTLVIKTKQNKHCRLAVEKGRKIVMPFVYCEMPVFNSRLILSEVWTITDGSMAHEEATEALLCYHQSICSGWHMQTTDKTQLRRLASTGRITTVG